MKFGTLCLIAGALLAGLVLGRSGPQADLRKARQELEELRRARPAPTALAGISQIMPMPDESASRRPRHRTPPPPSDDVAAEAPAPSPGLDTNAPPIAAVFEGGSSTNEPSFEDRIKEASELWRMRVALARNSFIQNTHLNEEQKMRFDVLMEAMNLRLASTIENWVRQLGPEPELGPEVGLRMLHELSGAMVVTYDELDRNLPSGWRDQAGDKFELMNFIDPDVALPLADLERAGTARGQRGRRRGP